MKRKCKASNTVTRDDNKKMTRILTKAENVKYKNKGVK